jgi:hypothetical protein
MQIETFKKDIISFIDISPLLNHSELISILKLDLNKYNFIIDLFINPIEQISLSNFKYMAKLLISMSNEKVKLSYFLNNISSALGFKNFHHLSNVLKNDNFKFKKINSKFISQDINRLEINDKNISNNAIYNTICYLDDYKKSIQSLLKTKLYKSKPFIYIYNSYSLEKLKQKQSIQKIIGGVDFKVGKEILTNFKYIDLNHLISNKKLIEVFNNGENIFIDINLEFDLWDLNIDNRYIDLNNLITYLKEIVYKKEIEKPILYFNICEEIIYFDNHCLDNLNKFGKELNINIITVLNSETIYYYLKPLYQDDISFKNLFIKNPSFNILSYHNEINDRIIYNHINHIFNITDTDLIFQEFLNYLMKIEEINFSLKFEFLLAIIFYFKKYKKRDILNLNLDFKYQLFEEYYDNLTFLFENNMDSETCYFFNFNLFNDFSSFKNDLQKIYRGNIYILDDLFQSYKDYLKEIQTIDVIINNNNYLSI